MPLRRRAYLGMELERDAGGLRVAELASDGPAMRAGVREGDRLLALDGAPLNDLAEVRRKVAALPHGEPCRLTVLRDQHECVLAAVAEALPLERLKSGRIALDELPWDAYRLRAVFSLPDGEGPHPLIWLLPGATWLSDEHPTTPWHPTRLLVEQLTAAGFATLRAERSGLGDSEGPPSTELDLDQELAGFRAAFECIEAREGIARGQLFVLGRSLGGMLLPLVLAEREVAGVATWGSSCRSWHDTMLDAARRQYRLGGMREAAVQRKAARLGELQQLVYVEGLSPEQAYERRPDLRDVMPEVFAGEQVYGRTARYFQQLQRCDLASAFGALRAPLLALHGGADWLSELHDQQAIAAACTRGRCRQIPGIDHHLHARPSVEEAYAEPWGGSFSPAPGEALIAFFRSLR